MRLNSSHWFIGYACLLPIVNAVPSPPRLGEQQPLGSQPEPGRPAWRQLSDNLIKKIWHIDEGYRDDRRSRQQWKDDQRHTKSRHGGDLLLRFNISTPKEAAALANVADFMYLDVWESNQDWVDIRMAKDTLPHVLKTLPESLQHAHTPLLQEKELAQAIYDTYPSPRKPPMDDGPARSYKDHTFTPALRDSHSSAAEANIFFTDYQPLSVIQPWQRLLTSLFTTHVRYINIGTSYEGREISALRVGVHPTNDDEANPAPRKTILITGGVHAREWISTSTVNFIAYSLITGYGKSLTITKLLEDFDFVFVPTINPDGYVYTWETDRLWRKNRQRTSLRFCYGMDLDRSFGFEWDGASTAGNPCSESYAGDAPFEGHESRVLADWVQSQMRDSNVEFVGFLDLHSYSQQILYPYSYSCDAAPPSLENLQELAFGLARAIRANHGHAYQAAPACEGNVAASTSADEPREVFPRFESGGGSALDWFYHELGVRYTYQIKLRDRGSYGFLLPKDHIVPTGREMLDAIMYFGRYLSEQYSLAGKVEEEEREKLADESVLYRIDETVTRLGVVQQKSVDDLEVDTGAYPELRRRRKL